jgi:ribose-phosphate pyrophosphokinase
MIVFTGKSNEPMAKEICSIMGVEMGKCNVATFSDGETRIEINESIRGKNAFIIQSTCPPTNDNLMELLILIDAAKRASAGSITAVIPYFGYARQDRKATGRTPISAKLVANLIETAGAHRVLTMELHAGQIQGFFDIPVDNLYAKPFMIPAIKERYCSDLCVVSPDAGGVDRARAYGKPLEADLAIIDKRRDGPNKSEVMNIVGDVDGKVCLLIDDIIDTAGTLTNAAKALKEKGAKKVVAFCVHPVLSGPAIERLEGSFIEELLVTDSIPLSAAAKDCKKIKVVSAAPHLAEAIRRIKNNDSVSAIFE